MTGEEKTGTFPCMESLYSKKMTVNKQGSLLNGRLAAILTERHSDVCNLPENAPRKKVN